MVQRKADAGDAGNGVNRPKFYQVPHIVVGIWHIYFMTIHEDLLLFHFYRSGSGFRVFNIQVLTFCKDPHLKKRKPNTTAMKLSSSES